jgi:hypothetical protein
MTNGFCSVPWTYSVLALSSNPGSPEMAGILTWGSSHNRAKTYGSAMSAIFQGGAAVCQQSEASLNISVVV